jgi:hypothetical protein
VYLKSLNNSGAHYINKLSHDKFKKSTFNRKLFNNIFFTIKGNKIYLRSRSKINIPFSNQLFMVDFDEITLFANKGTYKSNKIIKGWNDTTIKYLMISIFACRYGEFKPYALSLISNDIEYSASTIKRALKTFGVFKAHKFQSNYSPRSYYMGKKLINLSPNYYVMPIGDNIKTKH